MNETSTMSVFKGVFTLIFFTLILPNYGTADGKFYLNLMCYKIRLKIPQKNTKSY